MQGHPGAGGGLRPTAAEAGHVPVPRRYDPARGRPPGGRSRGRPSSGAGAAPPEPEGRTDAAGRPGGTVLREEVRAVARVRRSLRSGFRTRRGGWPRDPRGPEDRDGDTARTATARWLDVGHRGGRGRRARTRRTGHRRPGLAERSDPLPELLGWSPPRRSGPLGRSVWDGEPVSRTERNVGHDATPRRSGNGRRGVLVCATVEAVTPRRAGRVAVSRAPHAPGLRSHRRLPRPGSPCGSAPPGRDARSPGPPAGPAAAPLPGSAPPRPGSR